MLLTIIIYYFIILLLLSKIKFSFIHIILIFFFFNSIGLYIIGSDEKCFFTLEVFLMYVGLYSVGVWFTAKKSNICIKLTKPPSKSKLIYLLSFIFLIILYHYSIVGLPILSENIEVARFEMAESGLFGIPSRIIAYGPKFFIILAIVLLLTKQRKFFIYFFIGIALFITLVSGFKGALLGILIAILISQRFLNFSKIFYFYIILLILSSILYIYFMAIQYSSTNDNNILELMLRRITVVSIETFHYIVNTDVINHGYGNGMYSLQDFFYPIRKILDNQALTSIQELSASFYNRPLDIFNVPVTPSIFGYLYRDYGLFLTAFFSFLYGIISGKVYNYSNNAKTTEKLILLLFFD